MTLRSGVLALALVAVSAPGALAASLQLAVGDPVEMVPNTVTVTYDTGGESLGLSIYYRDTAGPPCAANAADEYALAGPDKGGQSESKPSRAQGTGTLTYTQVWYQPGPRRLCGYLTKTTAAPQGDTRATATLDVVVRQGGGTLALATSPAAIRTNGFYLVARATGTAEAPLSVGGVVVPISRACPPRFGRVEGSTLLTGPYATMVGPLTGPFAEMLSSQRPLAYGRWRACAYLEAQDGGSRPPVAVAEQIVDPKIRPRNLKRPDAAYRGDGRRRGTAHYSCDPGAWAAWPKATYRYAWRANGRIVSRRRTIDVREGRRIACRVTAVNRVGSTSTWSPTERA